MPFQKGNTLGKAGRPKKVKTQVKDWIKAHPFAVSALMQSLYDEGIKGDREAAIYIIDRIKGKPTQQTALDISGGQQLGVGLVVELFKILTERQKAIESREVKALPPGDNGANEASAEAEKVPAS